MADHYKFTFPYIFPEQIAFLIAILIYSQNVVESFKLKFLCLFNSIVKQEILPKA